MQNNKNPSRPPLIRGGVEFQSPPDKGDLGGLKGENAKSVDVKFIKYNEKLVSLARKLRKNKTEAEIIFWNNVLKNNEITDYKFTQQKPLGNFIADFYCSKLLLAVEIDGDIHIKLKGRDRERSEILLLKYGIKVIRYKNDDVLNNIGKVISEFKKEVKLRENTLKLRCI